MFESAALIALSEKISIKCSVTEEPEINLTMIRVIYNITNLSSTFNPDIFKLSPIFLWETFS